MKHQLKPLTILTGEENRAIYHVMDSISQNESIDSIYIQSRIFRYRDCEETIDIFNIPEHLLEMSGRNRIDIFEHYDRKFMPLELNNLTTKSVVFYYFPEIGLHPAKQRILARYIARLVNAGVYFVIATHSDILVHEFNNLILFGANEKKRNSIEKEYSEYKNTDGLRPEDVGMYITRQNSDGVSLESISIDKEGFDKTTFDKHLSELVDIQTMLLYGVDDE